MFAPSFEVEGLAAAKEEQIKQKGTKVFPIPSRPGVFRRIKQNETKVTKFLSWVELLNDPDQLALRPEIMPPHSEIRRVGNRQAC